MTKDEIIALTVKHGFKLVGGDYAFDFDDIQNLIEDALTAQPAAPAVVGMTVKELALHLFELDVEEIERALIEYLRTTPPEGPQP